MTSKTCVTQYSCHIFIWWPYLAWPWPLLSITCIFALYIPTILTCYLLHPPGCFMAQLEFTAIWSPVSVAGKARSDYFDLWPDIELTCDRVNFLNALRKNSLGAFERRLAHLATVTGLWVSRAVKFTPPPARQRGVFGWRPRCCAG